MFGALYNYISFDGKSGAGGSMKTKKIYDFLTRYRSETSYFKTFLNAYLPFRYIWNIPVLRVTHTTNKVMRKKAPQRVNGLWKAINNLIH